MDESQLINQTIADAIIERPYGFSVGSRHFYLYPVTLGKMLLTSRLTESLEIRKNNLMIAPFVEVLRVVVAKRKICAHLLAYHTLRKMEDFFNNQKVEGIKKFFLKELSDKDMATLILMILTSDKTAEISHHLSIDKEQERLQKVADAKKSKNSFTFGGVSLYGSILDKACERYKWSKDYVLWGISYTNLHLMLQDSIQNIFLTDDERKKVHITNDRERLNADDPKNWEIIKNMKLD